MVVFRSAVVMIGSTDVSLIGKVDTVVPFGLFALEMVYDGFVVVTKGFGEASVLEEVVLIGTFVLEMFEIGSTVVMKGPRDVVFI